MMHVIDIIPLGEAVLSINLEAFNERLEEKYPYDRANDFREALDVERNLDRAEMLYKSAIDKKSMLLTVNIFLLRSILENSRLY